MSSIGAIVLIVLGGCCLASHILALPTLPNEDAFIRFYTDSGNIVEIENRAYENPQNIAIGNPDLAMFPERAAMQGAGPIGSMTSLPRGATLTELTSGTSSGSSSMMMDMSQTNPYNSHKIVTRSGQRYCGESLINALALVCRGSYKKRTQLHGTSEAFDYPINIPGKSVEHMSNVDNPSWEEVLQILKNVGTLYRPTQLLSQGPSGPFAAYLQGYANSRDNMLNHDQSKVRHKRGVVDECCKKPCSTYELSKYCGARNNTDSEKKS